jgi:hypothetical protein
MNERIKELAKQAGFDVEDRAGVGEIWFDEGWYTSIVERFADLVRQDEREACASSCEDMAEGLVGDDVDGSDGAWYCANAIRATNRSKISRDLCGND